MRISDGDGDAANALVRDCRPKFIRFLARKGIFSPDSEDIVQEVFVAFFRQIPRGGATFQKSENGSPKSSNIRSPTIGTCEVDAPSRRQCRHCLATANYRSRTFRSSTKKAVDPESRALLLECLNKLPAMHRVILLLHETEGWTTDEIAALLKMKSGTVGRKLPEAKRMLGELGRRDIRGDAKKPDEGSD